MPNGNGEHPFITARHADNIVEAVSALNRTAVKIVTAVTALERAVTKNTDVATRLCAALDRSGKAA